MVSGKCPCGEAVANQNKHNKKEKKFSTERRGKTNVQRLLLLSATCDLVGGKADTTWNVLRWPIERDLFSFTAILLVVRQN
jgi:hypothetical protein